MKCCEKSHINWDNHICIECFNEMKLVKSDKKKIRNIPGLGITHVRNLQTKYVCPECGFSQLPETNRDKMIREGLV